MSTSVPPVTEAPTAVELNISGMSCAACAGRVERALNRIDGADAVVNYATERAVVTGLQPSRFDEAVAVVRKAGYGAEVRVDASDEWTKRSNENRITGLRRRLIVAALLTIPLMDLTLILALVPGWRFPNWELVCVALALPIVTWAAWPFHRATLRNLRHGAVSMDTLVSLGIAASFGWALVTVLFGSESAGYWIGYGPTPPGANAIYLDVAAGMTTFQLAGRYFEARSRRKAGDVLDALAALAPATARVRRDGRDSVVAISDVRSGDTVVVLPGETIPVDALVVDGWAAVDTSPMTGEPVPREMGPGATVMAGTINTNGSLVLSVTAVGPRTQLAQLAALAERAQESKARIQSLVDRIVQWFVPVIVVLAVLVTMGWLLSGAQPAHAISIGVAVLIIACPCALGLATPTALMVGVGRGAQLGVLIKGQGALEASGRVDTVVLDKTGTLTEGVMRVVDAVTREDVPLHVVLAMTGALEESSTHPVGAALVGYARTSVADFPSVTGFRVLPGLGVQGKIDGDVVAVGGPRLIAHFDAAIAGRLREAVDDARAKGASLIVSIREGEVLAVFSLEDQVKKTAASAIAAIAARGMRTILLTGDDAAAAERVATHVGIADVQAEKTPVEKAAFIASLHEAGHRVAMVGDGINDAAALATADLGMAVVSGTDVALKSADIILVRDDLTVVADAIGLSRRTLRTIRGNLVWAFGYNVAAIPLAAAGLLNPLVAAAAMALSSVFVVWNSLRLRNFAAHRPEVVEADVL
ncbi:heavy metal translocating P-type ATPase [Microbacterium proteolyticum]|uniref:heavy metal translocating P-type ATPase n=1 Tax=Microbacterium proteolyticum TaxID=1572644 RepID=UPI002415A0C8|nr:heavy metal translocating P-type ATPase [Microbacterium proteolyticum]